MICSLGMSFMALPAASNSACLQDVTREYTMTSTTASVKTTEKSHSHCAEAGTEAGAEAGAKASAEARAGLYNGVRSRPYLSGCGWHKDRIGLQYSGA